MWSFLIVTLLAVDLFGGSIQRCQSYVQEVRRAHWSQFGTDYPYQYGVGQLVQESGCRNIVSRDGVGSEGVSQITYRWHKDALSKNGIYDLRSTSNQIKGQAVLMRGFYDARYGLWATYQKYNGGSLVIKEIGRAGKESWELAKAQCKRGQSCFTYKGVKTCRDNCDINYEYSVLVWKYGGNYGSVKAAGKYRYW